MKKITLSLVFLSVFILVSCKKKEDIAPAPAPPHPTMETAAPPPPPPATIKDTLI